MTGRRGAGNGNRSGRRPISLRPPHEWWCRMPSCTATPTSRSSTAPRIPRSWPPRRHDSASRRWRSPTTTASTAWSASPRRPRRSASPRCSAPRSTCRTVDHSLIRSEADTVAQISTGLVPDSHAPDPHGTHLLVLADGPDGYARCRGRSASVTSPGRRVRRSSPSTTSPTALAGHAWVLTGCRKGAVPAALVADGPGGRPPRAAAAGRGVRARPGARSSCGITATRSTRPATTRSPRSPIATGWSVWRPTTSTTPHPSQRKLATALAAVRARRSLDEIDPWLPAASGAHLRSGAEQARRFRRYPGVVERAAEIGRAAAFDLALVAPNLPPFPCPPGPDRRVADRDAVPPSCHRGGRPPALRRATAAHRGPVAAGQGVDARSTTSWRSSSSSTSPATS